MPGAPAGAAAEPGGGQGGPAADGGTILILTLGYLMLAAMLAVVVTDVSVVYLARRSVASAADGAALAAVQRIDENAIYTAGEDFTALPLRDIEDTVADYQTRADPSGRTALTAELADPVTVRVEGSREVRLPVVGVLGVGPVTVRAGAQAQTRVRTPAEP
ncbi:putative Flp pilus-assembly TadE/G [Frankia sp. EI5c]|uniref:pilus assembly protein TadG-related protein n=1 Tax=Frankia sp. EI5c TaxID=683316 RepID=UPI0007C2F6AE|nr:pilus assembly protein TadG-related protein [Frankia sp. EI5c]OAA20126.1 putative Flp pilus-assembly TadE/G [Frankia sp. EI5c]